MAIHFNSDLRHQKISEALNHLYDQASSVLSLTLQWKHLENQFRSAHYSIDCRAKENLSMEPSILERLKQLQEEDEQLVLMEQSIYQRVHQLFLAYLKRLSDKENQLELSNQVNAENLKTEKKLTDERVKEVDLMEKKLAKKSQEYGTRLKELELKAGKLRGNKRKTQTETCSTPSTASYGLRDRQKKGRYSQLTDVYYICG